MNTLFDKLKIITSAIFSIITIIVVIEGLAYGIGRLSDLIFHTNHCNNLLFCTFKGILNLIFLLFIYISVFAILASLFLFILIFRVRGINYMKLYVELCKLLAIISIFIFFPINSIISVIYFMIKSNRSICNFDNVDNWLNEHCILTGMTQLYIILVYPLILNSILYFIYWCRNYYLLNKNQTPLIVNN